MKLFTLLKENNRENIIDCLIAKEDIEPRMRTEYLSLYSELLRFGEQNEAILKDRNSKPIFRTESDNFYLVDTYVEYDGPVFFLCRNQEGSLYLVEAAPDNQYILVNASEDRIYEVLNDKITLYDVFKKSENGTIILIKACSEHTDSSQLLSTDKISNNLLPAAGCYLELERVPAFLNVDSLELVVMPVYDFDINEKTKDIKILQDLDVSILDKKTQDLISISLCPWEMLLSMNVYNKTMEKLSIEDVLGAIILELSYMGMSIEKIEKWQENLENYLDEAAKEVKEGKMISIEEFKGLAGYLESKEEDIHLFKCAFNKVEKLNNEILREYEIGRVDKKE